MARISVKELKHGYFKLRDFIFVVLPVCCFPFPQAKVLAPPLTFFFCQHFPPCYPVSFILNPLIFPFYTDCSSEAIQAHQVQILLLDL